MLDQIKQIGTEKGLTFEQVAAHFGISRYQLRRIALKKSPGSIEFWNKMIVWSGGKITADTRFQNEINSVRTSCEDAA